MGFRSGVNNNIITSILPAYWLIWARKWGTTECKELNEIITLPKPTERAYLFTASCQDFQLQPIYNQYLDQRQTVLNLSDNILPANKHKVPITKMGQIEKLLSVRLLAVLVGSLLLSRLRVCPQTRPSIGMFQVVRGFVREGKWPQTGWRRSQRANNSPSPRDNRCHTHKRRRKLAQYLAREIYESFRFTFTVDSNSNMPEFYQKVYHHKQPNPPITGFNSRCTEHRKRVEFLCKSKKHCELK